jgi:hypothetical protein
MMDWGNTATSVVGIIMAGLAVLQSRNNRREISTVESNFAICKAELKALIQAREIDRAEIVDLRRTVERETEERRALARELREKRS